MSQDYPVSYIGHAIPGDYTTAVGVGVSRCRFTFCCGFAPHMAVYWIYFDPPHGVFASQEYCDRSKDRDHFEKTASLMAIQHDVPYFGVVHLVRTSRVGSLRLTCGASDEQHERVRDAMAMAVLKRSLGEVER